MKRKSSNVVRWWAKLMLAHNASVSHLTKLREDHVACPCVWELILWSDETVYIGVYIRAVNTN